MQQAIGKARRAFAAGEFARLMMSSAAIVAFQIAGTGLTFLYTLLMARLMTPADFGIVWSIWSAVLLASVAANLNIGNAAVREVVHARAHGEDDLATGFVAVARRLVLALALPAGALFVAAFALFAPATFAAHAIVIVGAGAILPVVAWERANTAIAAALGRGVLGRIPVLFVRPLLAFLGIGALALSGAAAGVEAVLAVVFGAVALAAVVQLVLLAPTIRALGSHPPRTDRWRAWIAAGIALIPSRTLAENLKNLFVVAASFGLGDADIARFTIAFSLIVFLNFGIMAVDVIFDPKISAAIARGETRRRDRLIAQSGALKLAPVALAALVLIVLAGPILSLFGPAYASAAPVIAWFVLMPLARTLAGPAIMVLQVSGERRVLAASATVGIVAIVAAVALIGASSGLVAAAAAGSLAYVAYQGAMYLLARLRTGVDPSPLGAALRAFR